MLRILNAWSARSVLFALIFAGFSSAKPADKQRPDVPFQLAPGKVIRLLRERELVKTGAFAEVEVKLLVDARDGTLDHFSFGEAVLVASGVTDPDARQQYLVKLDRLQAEAEKELAGAMTPLEQGERLLKFLHDHPITGGRKCNYSRNQTDMHTIFDAGKFNCVSSATLFNVLATRLGHNVRAVEIPEHVFSIFYDGTKWVDVETTNRLGFNPVRERATSEKLKKPNGTAYIPQRHAHLRREVGVIGLLSIIYYNHGVASAEQEQFAEAVVASFAAVGLDPANNSAIQNALAQLNDWSLALGDDTEFEKALEVVSVGLRAAPNNPALLNNRKVIWQEYAQWEEAKSNEGKAIAVLRRAAADVPDGNFLERQAYLFEDEAEQLIRAGNLNAALAVVQRAMPKIDEPARQRLRKWRDANVHNYVLRVMREKINAEQYEAALSAVAACAQWLDDEDTVRNFQRQVYDTWARKLARERKWQAAVDVYITALGGLSGDEHLSYNAVVYFDRWARSLMRNQDWEAAAKVYEQALRQFPNNRLLKQNLSYCKRQG